MILNNVKALKESEKLLHIYQYYCPRMLYMNVRKMWPDFTTLNSKREHGLCKPKLVVLVKLKPLHAGNNDNKMTILIT